VYLYKVVMVVINRRLSGTAVGAADDDAAGAGAGGCGWW